MVSLLPRDTRARFRSESSQLTDYLQAFSATFFKYHEPPLKAANLPSFSLDVTAAHKDDSINLSFTSTFDLKNKKHTSTDKASLKTKKLLSSVGEAKSLYLSVVIILTSQKRKQAHETTISLKY